MIPTPLGELMGVVSVDSMLICSPANAEAAQLYKDNTKEYERRVKVSYNSRIQRV
jgi:ubiquitin-protein ligase